jgi:hypothetical protein
MVTVNGLTKEHMEAIRDGVIVDARVDAGHLILTRYDDTEIDVGNVIGPQGIKGDTGATSIDVILDTYSFPPLDERFDGEGFWVRSEDALYFWNGTDMLMPHAGIPHSSTRNETTDTTGTESGDYVGFAHVVKIDNFFKKHDNAHVIVRYDGSVRNNNPWGQYQVGVHVYDVATLGTVYNQQILITDGYGDFGAKSGAVEIPGIGDDPGGIPKGHYNFELIKRRGNAVGTVFDGANNSNTNSMTVTETF